MDRTRTWLNDNIGLIVLVLIFMLAISSLATAVNLRQVNQTVKNTDLIAQCTTPGTRCSTLSAENNARNQKFFTDLITKANRCLLESAFQQGVTLTGADRIAAYDKCIARIPPLPSAANTTTSTTHP